MLFQTLLLASTASATCMHGLSFAKRATTDEIKISTFGYGPLDGAMNWASLDVANEACRMGKNQSPINIDNSIRPAPARPVISVPEVDSMDFLNLGSTIEVVVNGTTNYAGTDFRIKQFHMHTPSEHHINLEYYPLEIHMVHQGVNDPSQLAVIALMFEVSDKKSSSIIKSLSDSLPKITKPGTKTPIKGGIDFSDVEDKLKKSEILTYSGSLTTPPCAEGVTFLIVKEPLDISVADFNAIKKIVKFNSRVIQNKPGYPNLVEVGSVSGTPGAYMPNMTLPGNATAPGNNATVANAPVPVLSPIPSPSPGKVTPTAASSSCTDKSLTVTELNGRPTWIPTIIANRRSPQY
ncbi:Cah Carbonic anhydrase [Pyrenophora tritici-repentis]|uniref:Carbonic anhydrase n=1 Tax=Pyrenophora tritici-repentis TaxID=45151 RepID=A0A2W1HSD1_9PLEO|nr:Cah Carbonic anhydrase [Pyrenophora tritici-repentis]KAF7444871.1 Cah Carbonic anhydrase [Pyrenophora tritici-repentis]KAG9379112.1 Cah Carbonic anhydrase [Pyrenophora tritici-repentis]KAI0577440.1 Cah Carbonic anhydrase [Pyrenophora tritici-repentis]KAI0585089.1 Cah Carbonic anhydrase [Pyrenophora tritici-repentis]